MCSTYNVFRHYFCLILQGAPEVVRNLSKKVAQSQTICRVVATVLVLTLYIAAVGNIVSGGITLLRQQLVHFCEK